MRRPLWILNSALLVVSVFVLAFIVFSRPELPEREDIEPAPYTKLARAKVSEINLRKIYEDDLFGTYYRAVTTADHVEGLPELPNPPQPKPMEPLVWPKPVFLEPLNIALKGIIVVANDQARNSAIIADRKTNRESTYHVGDLVEDAQLLKIFSNKVIFLRPNGQQEVVYLREKDAKRDPTYTVHEGWQDVIQKLGATEYQVSPTEFAQRVVNLGQLIDLLDLTTVYHDGVSLGCRVGRVQDKSLGTALGLQTKDIVISVNDMPIADTATRFEVYKQVVATEPGHSVKVRVVRNGREIMLNYKLEEFKKFDDISPTTSVSSDVPRAQPAVTEQQLDILRHRHEFAPTVDEIRRRDRAQMRQVGQRSKPLSSSFDR